MSKFNDFFERANKIGLNVPLAHDSTKGQPSVTLFFMYLANVMAIFSLIYLHLRADAFVANCMTLLYAVISTVLYMMRKLQSAKFDLDDKSFELESDDNQDGDKKP